MARTIFISYRRDDSAYAAGRLYDRLSQHFGTSNVFMDIDAIELGVNFREKIENAVGHCDVLIAVIGQQWVSIKNRQGRRRLDDPDDFVRLEILAALKRNIHVIPVLVEEAKMPARGDLPGELAALCERNGLEIRHAQFNNDVNRLIKGLEAILSRFQPSAQDRPQTKPPAAETPRDQAGLPGGLKSLLLLTFSGLISGVILAGLAAAISGYVISNWLSTSVITNVLSGAIIGLIGVRKWASISTGMLVGFAVVLSFYALVGEPMNDAIGSALVLGCGPGGVLGAIVGRIRAGKQ